MNHTKLIEIVEQLIDLPCARFTEDEIRFLNGITGKLYFTPNTEIKLMKLWDTHLNSGKVAFSNE